MHHEFWGGDGAYTWTAVRSEHGDITITLSTPVFERREEKRQYHTFVQYGRYSLTVTRKTRQLRRLYPELKDIVTLADCSKQSLLQPKDWGSKRSELWTRTGPPEVTKGELTWADIKPLRPFFTELHPLVTGCFDSENFLPLVDWLSEYDCPLVRDLYTRPGELTV